MRITTKRRQSTPVCIITGFVTSREGSKGRPKIFLLSRRIIFSRLNERQVSCASRCVFVAWHLSSSLNVHAPPLAGNYTLFMPVCLLILWRESFGKEKKRNAQTSRASLSLSLSNTHTHARARAQAAPYATASRGRASSPLY